MRILGIDPGYAIVGVGVIEYNGHSFKTLEYGAITTPAGTAFPARLQMIYSQIQEILALYKPESMAVEKLYFNTNTTTAIDVAQARGVILLSASRPGCRFTNIRLCRSSRRWSATDGRKSTR